MIRLAVLAAALALGGAELATAQDKHPPTNRVGETVPDQKGPSAAPNTVVHPPTNRVGDALPDNKAATEATRNADPSKDIVPPEDRKAQAPGQKGPDTAGGAEKGVHPPTNRVGEAAPDQKGPAGSARPEHPPTQRMGDAVPPMKPGDAPQGTENQKK